MLEEDEEVLVDELDDVEDLMDEEAAARLEAEGLTDKAAEEGNTTEDEAGNDGFADEATEGTTEEEAEEDLTTNEDDVLAEGSTAGALADAALTDEEVVVVAR